MFDHNAVNGLPDIIGAKLNDRTGTTRLGDIEPAAREKLLALCKAQVMPMLRFSQGSEPSELDIGLHPNGRNLGRFMLYRWAPGDAHMNDPDIQESLKAIIPRAEELDHLTYDFLMLDYIGAHTDTGFEKFAGSVVILLEAPKGLTMMTNGTEQHLTQLSVGGAYLLDDSKVHGAYPMQVTETIDVMKLRNSVDEDFHRFVGDNCASCIVISRDYHEA
jgi:hypothetical protein